MMRLLSSSESRRPPRTCHRRRRGDPAAGFPHGEARRRLALVDALSVSEERLRALFAAGLAVSSELSLDALLHRLVQTAAELTGARYAALGVIHPSGSSWSSS